jgi:phosphopantothenoylcysteine decarboxylase/phosphopantothenate--cysteine ligase
MRVLITAGGTREYIDPVRFISNASSGKMGYALVRAALKGGHKVTVITTIDKLKIKNQKSKLRIVTADTASQMFEMVKKYFPRCDCLIMAAAVADYTIAHPAKTKIKKTGKTLTIKLKATPDIIRWAGNHKKKNQTVIGFAVEDKHVRRRAEKKMREKNLDMIIANTPAVIGKDKTIAQIKTLSQKWLRLPKATKTNIAKKIIALTEKITKER